MQKAPSRPNHPYYQIDIDIFPNQLPYKTKHSVGILQLPAKQLVIPLI